MVRFLEYLMFALILGAGIIIGTMASTPGKSESHAILNEHGAYDAVNNDYLVYLPNERDLTTEEYEALAVISELYNRVQIAYPNN